jgi:hypothetical protein
MDTLAFTLQHSRRAVSRQQTANQRTTLITVSSYGGLPRQLFRRCSTSCIHAVIAANPPYKVREFKVWMH